MPSTGRSATIRYLVVRGGQNNTESQIAGPGVFWTLSGTPMHISETPLELNIVNFWSPFASAWIISIGELNVRIRNH